MSHNYTLTCNLDTSMVSQLAQSGAQLCLAFAVSESNAPASFTVVAVSQGIQQVTTFSWQESYAIAAANSSFMNGAQFTASTNQEPINFGQSFNLPSNFQGESVSNDSAAPSSGFLFKSEASRSAPVLYKMIQGQFVPIYISPGAPLSQGSTPLVPSLQVVVWIDRQHMSAGTMLDFHSVQDKEVVDFGATGSTQATLQYGANGSWTK